MQKRAGEGVDCPGKGAGVGVERRHQLEAPGQKRAGLAFGGKRLVRAPLIEEQAAQRHQRPALALVAHPALIRSVKTALPVQIKVFLPPGALVHRPDAGAGGGEYLRVVGLRGGGAVAEVSKKEIGGVFIVVEAAKRFQSVADLKSALCGTEQHRHHHQQAAVLSQSIGAKFEQPAWTRKPRGDAPQKKHGRAPCEGRAQRQHQPTASDERVGGKQRRRQQRLRGDELMAARIGRHARQARAGAQPAGQRRTALVFVEPPADCAARARVFLRRRHGLPGHGLLAEAQAAADRLHLLAHGGARGRVHAGIGAVRIGAQFRLGAGQFREALLPVEGVEHALAADEIVKAHGQKRLGFMLQADHLFAVLAHVGHLILEPGAHFGQFPLHGKLQGALEKGRRIARAAHASPRFHKAFGCAALAGALQNGARSLAKGLGERPPQGGGHGPYLGHGERLHIVEGAQGQEQAFAAEGRIAQGHDFAHEHQHARHAAHGGQAHAAVQARLRGAGLHDARVLMQALQRGGGVGAFPQKLARRARQGLRMRRQGRGAGKARAAVHAQLHGQRAHVPRERSLVPLRARAELTFRAPRAKSAGKPCQTVHKGAFLLKYHC